MGRRDNLISRSILLAIFNDNRDKKLTILGRILAFFRLFQLTLSRYKDDLFKHLRTNVWEIDEDEYHESFRRQEKTARLKAIGDLGFSGSVCRGQSLPGMDHQKLMIHQTFFTTTNSKYLIKSVPRPSEYAFFRDELLSPYVDHVRTHPNSLLVRITDFLHLPSAALGSILGFAPSHHIIMENILYGQGLDALGDQWETYDLKPIDYFFPERDIAGGALTSESTKARLTDKFDDEVRITASQRAELVETLNKDTALLEGANVVDYSLFLVRYPAQSSALSRAIEVLSTPLAKRSTQWRTGIMSSDKKWIYRVVILDFFWAKHTLQAKAMTGLISSWNFFTRQGHMSITTNAKEYRGRFLRMVESILEEEET